MKVPFAKTIACITAAFALTAAGGNFTDADARGRGGRAPRHDHGIDKATRNQAKAILSGVYHTVRKEAALGHMPLAGNQTDKMIKNKLKFLGKDHGPKARAIGARFVNNVFSPNTDEGWPRNINERVQLAFSIAKGELAAHIAGHNGPRHGCPGQGGPSVPVYR